MKQGESRRQKLCGRTGSGGGRGRERGGEMEGRGPEVKARKVEWRGEEDRL